MKLLKREIFAVVLTLIFAALAIGFGLGQRQSEVSISVADSAFKGRGELYAEEQAADTGIKGSEYKTININTCSKEELESLPGIGSVLADRIIEYRASSGGFKTVEDITKVRGIGAVVYENVYMYISVD